MKDKVSVIMAAAGRGERMGKEMPKQFLEVAGRPILVHTLAVFERHPEISEIVVAVPPDWQERTSQLIRHFGFRKVSRIVCGGESRQESVFRAFEALSSEVEIVLVHDAARPLVDEKTVSEVIGAVKLRGAAICAVPARDTVKEVSPDMKVIRTLPRERIYLAQTPQGAYRSWLREAFSKARAEGKIYTDEASLLEAAGFEVHVVQGSFKNVKITYPEDLVWVEKYLCLDRSSKI